MAGSAKQETKALPTAFPADQLFVAVSDRGGEVAGEDGGTRTGGRGMWLVGQVQTWTADAIVPLALRDPITGLIWKGYLEPVERSHVEHGRIVCDVSTQYYVPNPANKPRQAAALPTETAQPSDAAKTRATRGARKLKDLVRPTGPTAGRVAAQSAGVVVD